MMTKTITLVALLAILSPTVTLAGSQTPKFSDMITSNSIPAPKNYKDVVNRPKLKMASPTEKLRLPFTGNKILKAKNLFLTDLLATLMAGPCFDKCAPHYTCLPQTSLDTVCHEFIEPGHGSLGDKPITGGYTCRFNNDYPPDDACPSGTTIHRYSDMAYVCHSSNPIPEGSITCIDGFKPDGPYTNAPGTIQAGWENSFGCSSVLDEYGDGVNEDVCTDPNATLLGGGGGDNCCAYLGPPTP